MKALLLLLLGPALIVAEPFKPANDDYVVEKLPASMVSHQRLKPTVDPLVRTRECLSIAQRTSDPAFIRYAEGLLEKAPESSEATFFRAVINQHKHEFDTALEQLVPIHSQEGLLLRASILTTLGRYQEVRDLFARNLKLTATLGGLTQFLTVTSLSGDLTKSEQALERALSPEADVQELAFAWCALGEMAVRRGDRSTAVERFQRSIALEPDNAYTLTAYCDLLLREGQKEEVLRRVTGNPFAESLQARRILAGEGDARELEERLRAGGHHREIALLQLDHHRDPRAALGSALTNWSKQREPIDALLVIRAANGVGSLELAEPVLQWVSTNRIEDNRIQQEMEGR